MATHIGGADQPLVRDLWGYNDSIPGPSLRARQGETLRVRVANRLAEETTIHWHGVRVPNAMDGVPHLTQAPIAPNGGQFAYEVPLNDAGTFWYHPHQRGYEQVARGLYGALIVDEKRPPAVDRDMLWILDDWRLDENGQLAGNFGHFMDKSHNGRVGNFVTINGKKPEPLRLRVGERVRLRLINAANARIFGLAFGGHQPQVIALDGQPVEPHEPQQGRVVLGPAMRADLIIDATGKPGQKFSIEDDFYTRLAYRLTEIVYDDTAPRRRGFEKRDPVRLPPNPLSEPDLRSARRQLVTLTGGMMGGRHPVTFRGEKTNTYRMMMERRAAWALNGIASDGHRIPPFLTLAKGVTCILDLRNETAWPHPMHLHGHSFRVLTRNGAPTQRREWQDTVLMAPRERVEIAFLADNPGDWMFHCHILEHMAAGMMAVIRVATT